MQTFKLKNNDCDNKESFDIEKADGNSIEMSCNTVLSFRLMNDRMQFSGPDLFNYFAKCLTMNALAEWHIVTPLAQEDCTKDSFVTCGSHILCFLLYALHLYTNMDPKCVSLSTTFGMSRLIGVCNGIGLRYSHAAHYAPQTY